MSAAASPPVSTSQPPSQPPLDLLTVYKQLATLPEVTSAFILSPNSQPNPPDILITTTVRDLSQDTKRDYHTTYTHTSASSQQSHRPVGPAARSVGGGTELFGSSAGPLSSSAARAKTAFAGSYKHNFPAPTDTLLTLPSPSGRLLLIIKKLTPPTPLPPTAPPQYIHDIYDKSTGRLLYSTPTTGVHGRMLFGGLMGGVRWEEEREETILYAAEHPQPVNKGWWDEVKGVSAGTGTGLREAVADSRGRQYDWKEEWGEQMGGISTPRLYILALPPALSPLLSAHLTAVEGIPAERSCGGAVWCGTSGLLYCGWEREELRKLGIAVYNTRRSKLYYIGWQRKNEAEATAEEQQRAQGPASSNVRAEGQPPTDEQEEDEEEEEDDDEDDQEQVDHSVLLTPDDHSPISPRLSLDRTALVYTTTEQTWHHWSGSRLRKLAWTKVEAAVRAEHERKKAGSSVKVVEGVKGLVSSVMSALSFNNGSSASSSSASAAAAATAASSDLISLLRSATTTVIDLVDRPRSIHSFPGLYPVVGMLPSAPWLGNTHILLTSYWRHSERMLLINTLTSSIIPIPLPPVSHLMGRQYADTTHQG